MTDPSDTPADVDALVANEMSDTDKDETLREHGTGVLALAREGEAYAVPVSFGYDGDHCHFVFVGYHDPSTKATFAETTERATLTVYAEDGRSDWHSVLVRGPVEKLASEAEWAAAREAIDDNGWYPSLFREADPRGSVDLWALEATAVTGYAASPE